MTHSPHSPLEISFYQQHGDIPQAAVGHLLRFNRYGKHSSTASSEPYELGADIILSPLGENSVEVWYTPDEATVSEVLSFGLPAMQLLITRGTSYTHVRFVGQETEGQKRSHQRTTRSSRELRHLTFQAYRKLFELIQEGAIPTNIVRMWNFIPDLLAHDTAIHNKLDNERYRQFNAGRQEAWWQYSNLQLDAHKNLWRVPAATVVGSADGPLIIEALLSRHEVIDIDNPRQILPYKYSSLYGNNSPMFSRATAQLLQPDYGLLFISGTASITGENTVHEDSIEGQMHETFANLQALTSLKNLESYVPFQPKQVRWKDFKSVRVHMKRTKDYAVVRSIVESYLGTNTPVCYAGIDISRDDCLVEIEANIIELVAAR